MFNYYLGIIPKEFVGYSSEFVSYMKDKPSLSKFDDDLLYNFTIGATDVDLNKFKIRTFLNFCYNSITRLDHKYIYETKLIDIMVIANRNNRNELKSYFTSLLCCVLCQTAIFNLFNIYPNANLILLRECRNILLNEHARVFIKKINCQTMFNKYKYYKYMTFVIQHYSSFEELKNIIYKAPTDISIGEMVQILTKQVLNKLNNMEKITIVRAIYLRYNGIDCSSISLYAGRGVYNIVKLYVKFKTSMIYKQFNKYLLNIYIKYYIKNNNTIFNKYINYKDKLRITKRKFEEI